MKAHGANRGCGIKSTLPANITGSSKVGHRQQAGNGGSRPSPVTINLTMLGQTYGVTATPRKDAPETGWWPSPVLNYLQVNLTSFESLSRMSPRKFGDRLVLLYRILGAKDELEEGWFTVRGDYKTPDGSQTFRQAMDQWLSEGPGSEDLMIRNSPDSAHAPPSMDKDLRKFWGSFTDWPKSPKLRPWHQTRNDWYCAFLSLDQLKSVFQGRSQRAYMNELGVRMAVFKVHARYVKKAEKQCLFLVDKAYDVEYHPISWVDTQDA